jgi:hypothetical protein
MNHEAIYNTHPSVVRINDSLGAFDVDGNPVTLDQAKVDAEVARLQAESDATKYQRDRKAEYPSIGDQLDALFHAGVFPADMAAQLQAVKDKYPR